MVSEECRKQVMPIYHLNRLMEPVRSVLPNTSAAINFVELVEHQIRQLKQQKLLESPEAAHLTEKANNVRQSIYANLPENIHRDLRDFEDAVIEYFLQKAVAIECRKAQS